jgi:hypothetical protein
VSGTVNTGGGGGGGGGTTGAGTTGSSGGSGVIVLRFPNTMNIRIGTGLSSVITTLGSDIIVTITAGTDTVTFF